MQTQMTSTYEGRGSRSLGRRDDQIDTFGRPARKDRGAVGLGLFSIALGLSQVLSPRQFTSFIGVGRDDRKVSTTLAVGIREIACGLGLLAVRRPVGFLWARVAGDVMDLVLLGRSLQSRKSNPLRVLSSMAAVAGVLVIDGVAAARVSRVRAKMAPQAMRREGLRVVKAITVNRSPDEVYAFWRDLQNLPRFMTHLESVTVNDGRSRWRAKAPAGMTVEWEAIITADRPGELLAWRSVEGSTISSSGSVRFAPAPGGRGTEIHVDLQYKAPGGRLGAGIAKLFGEEPSQQINGDLRRFKQVIETGEVVHSDASIHRGMYPARPSKKIGKEISR